MLQIAFPAPLGKRITWEPVKGLHPGICDSLNLNLLDNGKLWEEKLKLWEQFN